MAQFMSRSKLYTIVIQPGRFTLDQVGARMFIPGRRVVFKQHKFTTDDAEIIELLRNHRKFGVDFWEVTDEDRELIAKASGNSRMNRGAATTQTVKGVPNRRVEPDNPKPQPPKSAVRCPECGKTPPEGHENPEGWLKGHKMATKHGATQTAAS